MPKLLAVFAVPFLLLACNSSPVSSSTGSHENKNLGVSQASLQGPSPISVMAQFTAGDTANGVTVEQITVSFPRMFALDETEVTVNQYADCVSAYGCTAPDTATDCNWNVGGRGSHPVNCVTYGQAVSYCSWAGKRLPTHHEWEYAARFPDGRMYPWGNSTSNPETLANTSNGSDGYSTTAPVGSYSAGNSALGLKDMSGNVYEWTQTSRCIWETGSCTNCPSDETCDNACDVCGYANRSLKGGSYLNTLTVSRAAGSADGDITGSGPSIGFRCALTVR